MDEQQFLTCLELLVHLQNLLEDLKRTDDAEKVEYVGDLLTERKSDLVESRDVVKRLRETLNLLMVVKGALWRVGHYLHVTEGDTWRGDTIWASIETISIAIRTLSDEINGEDSNGGE